MSTTICWEYYPKECNNPHVLPFLSYDSDERSIGSKDVLTKEFFNLCREFGKWNEYSQCWIFDNTEKLFAFAARSEVPVCISDYISECNYLQYTSVQHNPDDIFIIWKR